MTDDRSWTGDMPEVYDRILGPALFAPFARRLAALAAESSPRRVLELAAGTGIATAELVRTVPEAEIIGTDLNPAMVAWASGRVPGPTWLIADAQHPDIPAAPFDLILCQFGVMFFQDKGGAFAQMRRLLAPDGTVLLAVWDTIAQSPFPAALVEALAAVFPDGTPDFVARIPHGYHDREQITADLAAGGLVPVQFEPVVLSGAAPSAALLAEGFCLGTPLRFTLEQRGPLAELVPAVAASMTTILGPGPVSGDLAALVVTARARG